MRLFKKKQGFKSNNNFFRRLYVRYSGLLLLVAVFSLGIFGTSIYYKNQPSVTASQQGSSLSKVEAITSQLNTEKDITDSLSSKNVELKQRLKEALSQSSDNINETKVTELNNQLDQEKITNQKLNDENARLKVRINNMLAKIEAIKNKPKISIADSELATPVEGGRKMSQDNDIGDAESKNFNKVKMSTSENNETKDSVKSLTNRNKAEKMLNKGEVVKKKVVKGSRKRTMRLKKGESLWNLSKRAYGKGIYYKKIIKANPSLTEKSFKRLRPGARINVPR